MNEHKQRAVTGIKHIIKLLEASGGWGNGQTHYRLELLLHAIENDKEYPPRIKGMDESAIELVNKVLDGTEPNNVVVITDFNEEDGND